MSQRTKSLTRRRFLRGAGGVSLALPFLSVFGDPRARASADAPKRIVVFTVPHNETVDMLPARGPGRGLDLRGTYLEAFQPFASKSLLVSNLHADNGHAAGMSEWLTGRPGGTASRPIPSGGPSVDCLLAERWRSSGAPIPHLSICTTDQYGYDEPYLTASYTAEGAAITPDYDPRAVFEKVYGPVGGGGMDDDAEARSRALQVSLLDSVRDEYERLVPTLGAADRQRLDAHLSAIRDQERRIQDIARFSCEAPTPPEEWVRRSGTLWRDNLPKLLDQAGGALMCGATRVVTVRSHPGTNSLEFAGSPHMRHDIAHGDTGSGEDAVELANSNELHFGVRDWETRQLLPLIERLDATPEPDGEGSMLDNSAVIWLPELGISDVPSHRRDRMPVFIMGGAGGGFSTDQYFDAEQNYTYQDFLLTLVQGMGCSDIASFGDAGNRPITEILGA